MDLNQFLSAIPATTRERASAIKDALNNKDIYISIINKNDKKYFKLYYYNDDKQLKNKQLKISDISKQYILKNKDIIEFSDNAKKILDIK